MKNLYKVILDPKKKKKSMGKVSLVKNPAIQTMFVKMSEELINDIKLYFNEDKMIIAGPVLIPNQKIWRNEVDGYITFDSETINLLQSEYSKNNDLTALNIEHTDKNVSGYVKESWITGSIDKSQEFGYDLPEGTWFMITQITDPMLWKRIKEGEINGYSIEAMVDLTQIEMSEEIKLESYNDYPESIVNNAKAVLSWVEMNGWGDCGTEVGKIRANQLANKEPISFETIQRMYSYLSRHKVDLDTSKEYGDGCGKLMYDSWGGEEALIWSENKINEINKEKINLKMKEWILEGEVKAYTEEEIPSVGISIYSDMEMTKPLIDGEYEMDLIKLVVLDGKIFEIISEETINEVVEMVIEPKSGEDEQQFISRCIGEEINNGYEQSQAAAICYSKWKQFNMSVEMADNMTGDTTTSETQIIEPSIDIEEVKKLKESYDELIKIVADLQGKVSMFESMINQMNDNNIQMSEQLMKLSVNIPESKRKITLSKEDIDNKTQSKIERIESITSIISKK